MTTATTTLSRKGERASALDLQYLEARPVVVRAWKRLDILLVGCGGTGSWVALSLARLAHELRASGKSITLTFIDPDHVEAGNIPRQNFSRAEIGLSKAATLAMRFGTAWGLDIRSIVAPFNVSGLKLDREGLAVVVGCVDNAAARRSISEVLARHNVTSAHADAPPEVWWLDCGNARDSGQVLLGSAPSVEGLRGAFEPDTICRALPSPALQRPELLEALPDEQPDASEPMSCAQLAALNVQSLMVNQNVAAIAGEYLRGLVMGSDLRRFATYIDLPSGTAKSFYTTPEVVAAAVGKTPKIFKRPGARLITG